jgi:hypothetical protein
MTEQPAAPSAEWRLWQHAIMKAMNCPRVSASLQAVIVEQHSRRGYGNTPTVATVALVAEACEEEGIFGPGA